MLIGEVARRAILVDTSAAIALLESKDPYHHHARNYFAANKDAVWIVVNATTHEAFTRRRYDVSLPSGLKIYNFLTHRPFKVVAFQDVDEVEAVNILKRYNDQIFSFHDALCFAIMKRIGIYRVFTFDSDFWSLGFQIEPGITFNARQ